MEVGLMCSCCDTLTRMVMASSSPQCLRTCATATASTLLNARRGSSSRAFPSSAACGFPGVPWQQRQHDERPRRHARQSGGGPIAPRSIAGGGGGLPGNSSSEWPPSSHISPPGLGQFRPPPSCYTPNYEETEEDKQNAESKKTLLIEKLRDGHGSWQERAAFVKELQQLGVTSEDLYSQTFVPIVKQLEMVVAAQVYESLVQSGTSQEILQWFDESSLTLLYALRTLSARQRRSAAEYVIENSLSVEEAQKLAWAIKDHERRPAGRQGFTTAAGDCLAFMYHRQVIETGDGEQKEILVEQGLKVAVTDSAKERFSEFAIDHSPDSSHVLTSDAIERTVNTKTSFNGSIEHISPRKEDSIELGFAGLSEIVHDFQQLSSSKEL